MPFFEFGRIVKSRICEDLCIGRNDRIPFGTIYHWLIAHNKELATSLSIYNEDVPIMTFPSGTDFTDPTGSSVATPVTNPTTTTTNASTPSTASAKTNRTNEGVGISQRESETQQQNLRQVPPSSLSRQASLSFPSVKHISYNALDRRPNTVSLYTPTILKTLSLWCYSFNFKVMTTFETIMDQLELEQDLSKSIEFNVVRDVLVTALQPVVMGNDYRYLNGFLQYMEQVLGCVCIVYTIIGISK